MLASLTEHQTPAKPADQMRSSYLQHSFSQNLQHAFTIQCGSAGSASLNVHKQKCQWDLKPIILFGITDQSCTIRPGMCIRKVNTHVAVFDTTDFAKFECVNQDPLYKSGFLFLLELVCALTPPSWTHDFPFLHSSARMSHGFLGCETREQRFESTVRITWSIQQQSPVLSAV